MTNQMRKFINGWSLKDIIIIISIGINIGITITRLDYIEKIAIELKDRVHIIEQAQADQKLIDNNQNNQINNLK